MKSIKFRLVKIIEKIPFIQLFIYNNLNKFKFLLPHDKDYHALELIFKKEETRSFLDVGGNNGVSTLGFRQLGYKSNKIIIFEPDPFLIKKYLNNIKNKYKKISIFNFGLSFKNSNEYIYQAYYKEKHFHFNNSFDLKYIRSKLKHNYPEKFKSFKIKKKKLNLKNYDQMNFNENVCFIKIDVEGFDHLVILGMKKLIKKFLPVFLIEYNHSNFLKIYNILCKNYYCYRYLFDKNKLLKLNIKNINKLKKGIITIDNYNKNSINVFFIPKKFKMLK